MATCKRTTVKLSNFAYLIGAKYKSRWQISERDTEVLILGSWQSGFKRFIEALKEMMPLYREGISLAFDKVTKKKTATKYQSS